jgi:hypothetical protein
VNDLLFEDGHDSAQMALVAIPVSDHTPVRIQLRLACAAKIFPISGLGEAISWMSGSRLLSSKMIFRDEDDRRD